MLGQVPVATNKENEITAAAELLRGMAVKGRIITGGVMSAQKGDKESVEVVCGITSLSPSQADASRLLALSRPEFGRYSMFKRSL